ncbi:chitinase [Desulfocucumis palustris]|uniref:Chitinase n=1 Tax=Desulfocucumis palustris TaxID=1898651 RepID=A0A2L2XEG1_9FIRM|nr:fibronectin type III domain-containing protein [Desulfocucumis palustris]GBF32636.1 chitinase [Desulfocucumis palustris]
MKKLLSLSLFIVLLTIAFCIPAMAGTPKVVLDGNAINFDVPPTIEEGRTLVPLRAIFEALGANVGWDGATQTVTATKGQVAITLVIGGKAYKNNTEVILDVPAKVVNGRTLVPLRFVSEALGAGVDWDGNTETVAITSATPAPVINDQASNGPITAIAPALVNAMTSTDGKKLLLTFNKSMANPAGKQREFTVLVNGRNDPVTAAALDQGGANNIILTLDNPVTYGSTVNLAYSAGSLTAADGSVPASFGARSVSNTVSKPPLKAPAGLTTSAGNGRVILSWKAVNGATGYKVYRAESSDGQYTQVASRVTGTSYTVSGLTNWKNYYFAVKASNVNGDSDYSSREKETPEGPPGAPAGLEASAGKGRVSLDWDSVDGATGYKVFRNGTQIASGVDNTRYTVEGLTNCVKYNFVVKASNNYGDSANSIQVSAIPEGPAGAPTGLTASAGNSKVTLKWNQVTGATGYRVYRGESSGGPYDRISSVVAGTSYTVDGLNNRTTYYFVVKANNSYGDSNNSNQVSAIPVGPTGAPTGVTASAGNGLVTLNWNSVAGVTGYKVYRTTSSNGPYTQAAAGVKGTTYTVGGLANGTKYYFVVKASNSYGDSENSSQVKATPEAPPRPDAPTGLKATAGNCCVTLSWHPVAGATGYKIFYSESSGGHYNQVASGVAGTSYTVDGLTNGETYYFMVKSSNSNGDSEYSNKVKEDPIGLPTTRAPTGLKATAGNGRVTLSWNQVTGATGYKVYRAGSSGGPYTLIASGVAGTSYTADGLTNGAIYYFVAKATNAYGDSNNSNEVKAAPVGQSLPNVPTGLTASAGNGCVTLTWNKVNGATGYKIFRGEKSGGPYTQAASGETGTSYTEVGLTNGITYYFVVKASNVYGSSENSNQVRATPAGPPGAPAGLIATAGNSQVTLNWNPVDGAADYEVCRAGVSGGPYTRIAAGVVGTGYTAGGLDNGTTYYFVVKANNAYGDSGNSNQVSATPVGPPRAPGGLRASAGNGQVTLNWDPADGAAGYKVYQSSGGPYTQIATGVPGTSYTVDGLANGTAYYFVVKASNANGDSGNSNQASAIPAGS